MTWAPFSVTLGNDGRPLHSALARDVIHQNLIELKTNSCVGGCASLDTVALTTTSTSYVLLAWFPMTYVRAPYQASSGYVPNIRIEIYAHAGTTATLRVFTMPSASAIVAPTLPDAALYTTTSTGAVTSTWAWHSLTLNTDTSDAHRTIFGAEAGYQVLWGGILGKVETASTLSVLRYTWEEL